MSTLTLDMNAANLPFPTGKNTAINRINTQLPLLIKDSILALNVDSTYKLEDLVLNGLFPFTILTEIIDEGKKTPGTFSRTNTNIYLEHMLNLKDLSSTLVKHNQPYSPRTPIEQVSSRKYTGIIIDARGNLPVQGEFVDAQGEPCFFPKIWDENMDLLYERNMANPSVAKQNGIIKYDFSDEESRYLDRIGKDPLRIKARKLYGTNRTDPVISRNDALKILSVPENMELLKQGKVVILLDEDKLVHVAEPNVKDEAYYVVTKELQNYQFEWKIPDVMVLPTETGTKISIQNLQFIADSSQLLPEEQARLDSVAEMLKTVAQSGEFTITVEGHTASVGKPTGELNLSIERAQAIIQALQQRNIDTSNFTYKGYGGTMPVGDNSTEEGRAQNRRVEIMVIPKATYIQRDWGSSGSMRLE
ncbi:MAG: OmpA family protein [Spirochaetaceae bacterium]|nr:OmpA family protein [Spirochaetaceae bacterium]